MEQNIISGKLLNMITDYLSQKVKSRIEWAVLIINQ